MGYEILFQSIKGEVFGLYLGSATDVHIVSQWAEMLPKEKYPAIRALLLEGKAVNPSEIATTIDDAFEEFTPPDAMAVEVAMIADHLADTLDRWNDGTLAILSDGVNLPDNPFGRTFEKSESEEES